MCLDGNFGKFRGLCLTLFVIPERNFLEFYSRFLTPFGRTKEILFLTFMFNQSRCSYGFCIADNYGIITYTALDSSNKRKWLLSLLCNLLKQK